MSQLKSGARKPSWREVLKPAELIGIAFVIAIFVGLIALLSTREPLLALIGAGVAFIVTLIVLAMFTLSFAPSDNEKIDIREQDQAVLLRSEERKEARKNGASKRDGSNG
jgi:uncharacterized membrane protein YgaE (UPF0421/DUF939 family)